MILLGHINEQKRKECTGEGQEGNWNHNQRLKCYQIKIFSYCTKYSIRGVDMKNHKRQALRRNKLLEDFITVYPTFDKTMQLKLPKRVYMH